MKVNDLLNKLPVLEEGKKVIAVLSGGMDSTIMTHLLVAKYGYNRVIAVSYNYGQKQSVELDKAVESCQYMNITHHVLDLKLLGQLTKDVCANISGTDINMPTIEEAVDEQPVTYVPYRNMILLSLTMALAESNNASHIFTGIQVHDSYGYWDTSNDFVDSINAVSKLNINNAVEVQAPFSDLSKAQELNLLLELEGNLDLLKHTLTCYNPDTLGRSCSVCPSCVERLSAFESINMIDPIPYS